MLCLSAFRFTYEDTKKQRVQECRGHAFRTWRRDASSAGVSPSLVFFALLEPEQHSGMLLDFPVEPDTCRPVVQDPIFCFGFHFRSLFFFFCIIDFIVLIYFLVGGKLLYNGVLVSVIQHCTSAIIIHISHPVWASLTSPHPTLKGVITELQAELPVFYRWKLIFYVKIFPKISSTYITSLPWRISFLLPLTIF